MGWIPYVAMAVGQGINYLKQRGADRQAERERRADIHAYQNDPKVLMKNALVNELFAKHPEWAEKYPGVQFALLHPPAPKAAKPTADLLGNVGNLAVNAGEYYARQHPKGSGVSMPSSKTMNGIISDSIYDGSGSPADNPCPPGQIDFGPPIGCH